MLVAELRDCCPFSAALLQSEGTEETRLVSYQFSSTEHPESHRAQK